MIIEVRNDKISFKVRTLGAELCSAKINGSSELIWQGNAEYWASHAPILFPIVGALRDNKALINGQYYTIPKHGLVRKSEWTLCEQGENFVEMEIKSDEQTLEAYPFEFTLKARYELVENGIKNSFIVTNNSDKEMPYFIGGHTGFNLPFEDGFSLEDYEIEFSEFENLKSPQIITETSIYDFTKSKAEIKNQKSFKLNNELFSNDVIVYSNFKKKEIGIKNSKTNAKIVMNFEDMNMMGIWKPYNDAPFLCLEPWLGCSTTTTENDEFVQKTDCNFLKPNHTASHSFTIKVN